VDHAKAAAEGLAFLSIDPVEKENVQVWIEAQIRACPLERHDGAALTARHPRLLHASGVEPKHRLHEEPRDSAQERGVKPEARAATSSGGDDYRAPTPGGSVATAVRNTPRYQPSRAPWPPGACAEAAAIDRYLVAARRHPANAGLGDRALLRQIPRGGIDIRHHDNPSEGNRRSPCPNCRQMLLELGIHPETDPRIAGNPRSSRARPLTSGRRGRALRS